MELFYRIAADVIVILHAAFAGTVMFGLAAILLGIWFGWRWVRNFWFRLAHLLMIGFVAAETLLGFTCPLTDWENELRRRAGQTTYQGGFIANWVHELLFYEAPGWVFATVYVLFGLAVLATFVLAPPRRPGRKD